MPIEAGNLIVDLDATWPLSGDPVSEGDDHVRLIKTVLTNTFPGEGGQGYAVQINATEDELNALVGLDTSQTLQQQMDNIFDSVDVDATFNAAVVFTGNVDVGGLGADAISDFCMVFNGTQMFRGGRFVKFSAFSALQTEIQSLKTALTAQGLSV